MKNLLSVIGKNPKTLYVVAILTIFIFTIINQIISQLAIGGLVQKGKVIVLSEHQGMLHEKIGWLVQEYQVNPQPEIISDLHTANEEWTATFQKIKHASEGIKMSAIYKANLITLIQQIEVFEERLSTAIGVIVSPASQADKAQSIAVIRQHKKEFQPLMSALVKQWQNIAEAGVKKLRLIEIVLAFSTLLILVFEFIFIFRPAFINLNEKNLALQNANQEQAIMNEELISYQEEIQQSLEYQTRISKKLEEAKLKAEAGSRAKEEFLSVMSHEIRTPMNAVIGLTCLLLENNPKPNQVENLTALKFSADTLLSLINNILDYSKIEAGKIELEEISFSLNTLFKGLKQSLGVNAIEKEISLNCNLSDDIPATLLGDPTRLSQILNNLVGNAIKFTLQGEVNVSATLTHITDHEAYVQFIVQDTGIGIPEDKLEDIFQGFTQASKDTSRIYGGTGLGLAISKKLLAIQQSDLKVTSQVNKGTTFSFSLGFKYKTATNQTADLATNEKGSAFSLEGIKVLVAEDNQMNVIVIRQFLTKWKADFLIVQNGLLAVEAIRNEPFDLILMDLQMPEMDGFDASREIRKFNQDIPIIALTAAASLEVQKNVFLAQMSDFATKPFVPEELFRKIEKHTV